jgi:hypothetical protein
VGDTIAVDADAPSFKKSLMHMQQRDLGVWMQEKVSGLQVQPVQPVQTVF